MSLIQNVPPGPNKNDLFSTTEEINGTNTNSSRKEKEILSLEENVSLCGEVPQWNIHPHPSKDGAKAENVLAGPQSGISTVAKVTRPPMSTITSVTEQSFQLCLLFSTRRVLL